MLASLRRVISGLFVAAGLLSLLAGGVSAEARRPVLVGSINGIINPIQASYVSRVIGQAEDQDAAAVVFQMDTPGGLDTSMRQIIQRMLSSRVPVMVYVSPPGSRAGSAGVFITYAAHVAAMAPNTNIGSAHPVAVGEGGGEATMSDDMKAKVTNDAVATIRSLAERRDRNADWAEQAVRQSVNVTANAAAQEHIIDFTAGDLRQLLDQANGRTVDLATGPVVLETAGAPIESAEMTPFEHFLHAISDPTIAYLLLSLGSLGLMLELYNPGQVLPGVVGGVCLLLALFALGTLPVNYAGLLLIGFGFLLFVADVLATTHGVLTVGGLTSFILGSLILFNNPEGAPFLRVSIPAILGMAAVLVSFFVFVFGAIARSRRRPAVTGREALIGRIASVRTRLAPEGFVHLEGELWRARSEGRAVEAGEQVRVVSIDGLLALVTPVVPDKPPADPAIVTAPTPEAPPAATATLDPRPGSAPSAR